jgi:hypothetical protein
MESLPEVGPVATEVAESRQTESMPGDAMEIAQALETELAVGAEVVEPTIAVEHPATAEVSAEEPAGSAEEPAGSAEEPAVSAEEPASSAEEPAVSAEEPAVSSAEEPVVSAELAEKQLDSVDRPSIPEQVEAADVDMPDSNGIEKTQPNDFQPTADVGKENKDSEGQNQGTEVAGEGGEAADEELEAAGEEAAVDGDEAEAGGEAMATGAEAADEGATGEVDDSTMPNLDEKHDAEMELADDETPMITDFSTPPKRPTPSFFLYSMHIGPKMREENRIKNGGKINTGEVSKEIADMWSKMTDAERKVYEDKSAAQKERYEAYLEVSDPLVALRTKYAHLIPKKPLHASALYGQDPVNREKATQLLVAEGKHPNFRHVTAKVSEMWKQASGEERAQVQEKALKLQLEFLSKQTAWQGTPECEELQQAERVHEAGKRSVLQAAKTKKPAKVVPKSKAKAAAKKVSKSSATSKSSPSKVAPSTPSKRSQSATVPTPVSEAKRSRKSGGGKDVGPQLDNKVLVKAQKLGLEEALRNLASRPEVMSSGKSTQKILDALQAKGGLVNAAKHVLLGK